MGLGFGSCFLPIYLDHPNVNTIGIYDSDEAVLNEMAERYQVLYAKQLKVLYLKI